MKENYMAKIKKFSYYSNGLLEELCQENRQKLEENPSDHSLRCSLANALIQLGELEEAIFHLRECIKLEPSPEYWNSLGKAQINSGKYEEAIESFGCVVAEKNWPDAYFNIGKAYVSLNNLEKALKMLGIALDINPKYREALNEKAHILEAMGKKDEALIEYKKIIALFFGEYQAHDAESYNYEITVLLDNEELTEELIRQLKSHVRRFPGYADGYYKLGKALEAKGLQSEALLAFRKALEINPNYETARKCFWK